MQMLDALLTMVQHTLTLAGGFNYYAYDEQLDFREHAHTYNCDRLYLYVSGIINVLNDRRCG